MFRFACLPLLLVCGSASAQSGLLLGPGSTDPVEPPSALLGTWGTASQCARSGDGESPSPLRIEREWIYQGGIYCYLGWRANYATGADLETHALAQCGEDGLREYRILLRLQASRLQIRWTDSYTTPSLQRCED